MRVAREREDRAVDRVRGHELRQLARRPEHRHARHLAAHLLRVVVGEPDHVDAVLRMLHQLARDELADVACTDDHGALARAARRAHDAAHEAAPADDERDRSGPEDGDRGERWIAADDEDDDGADPGAAAEHREQLHDLVDRGVVGRLQLAAVEAGDVGHDQPAEQERAEQQDAEQAEHGPCGRIRDEEGGAEGDRVGERERERQRAGGRPGMGERFRRAGGHAGMRLYPLGLDHARSRLLVASLTDIPLPRGTCWPPKTLSGLSGKGNAESSGPDLDDSS